MVGPSPGYLMSFRACVTEVPFALFKDLGYTHSLCCCIFLAQAMNERLILPLYKVVLALCSILLSLPEFIFRFSLYNIKIATSSSNLRPCQFNRQCRNNRLSLNFWKEKKNPRKDSFRPGKGPGIETGSTTEAK